MRLDQIILKKSLSFATPKIVETTKSEFIPNGEKMKRETGKFRKTRWGAHVYIGSGIIKDELFCLDLDKPITIENVEGGVLIHQNQSSARRTINNE